MPPMWAADHVLARMRWPLRYLDAVVEAPTIRADGSILSAPGWDELSALLYAPRARGAVAERPGFSIFR